MPCYFFTANGLSKIAFFLKYFKYIIYLFLNYLRILSSNVVRSFKKVLCLYDINIVRTDIMQLKAKQMKV